nr:ester cyclase [Paenibacillus guangzhouensis]
MAAFPDKAYTIEDIIGEGDRVLVRMTMRGTHQGVFYGHAPTERKTEVTLYREYRVADGRIAEHRG